MSTSLETDRPQTAAGVEPRAEDVRIAVFAHLDDPTELTEVLAACAGIHPDDAMRAAHLSPGLLPMRLKDNVARAVVQELERQGIRAVTFATTEIPTLDPAVPVHHLGHTSEGIELLGIHGELRRQVRWTEISLLSAGSVPLDEGQRLPPEPQVVLHAAPNPHRAVAEVTRRPGLVLWMLCERPWEVFRFVHNQMGYEHLGERKTASSMRNFTLFLEDLASHAPQAYLTPATRALLHHGISRHFEFHSSQELRDYTVFHILAQRQVARMGTPVAPAGHPEEIHQ